MDKIIRFLGIVCLALIIFVIISTPFLFFKGRNLDKESRRFVEDKIVPIIAQWDEQEFARHTSSELAKVLKKNNATSKLFTMYRKLGKLESLKSCSGKAKVNLTTDKGIVITGEYILEAVFEQAEATIKAVLIKHEDLWQIYSFRVNTEKLFDKLRAAKAATQQTNHNRQKQEDTDIFFKSFKIVSDSNIVIRGILYGEQGRSVVINNEILSEGDVVLGATILRIGKDRVLFERDAEKFVVLAQSRL